jgi:hypothetical protein
LDVFLILNAEFGGKEMKNVVLSLALILNCGAVAGLCVPVYAQSTMEIARGNCKATSDRCQSTLDYCNKQTKSTLSKANVTDALKDCIEVCNSAEKILERNSKLSPKMSELTIAACTVVAKTCDQFPKDDRMQACANEARKCIGNLQKVASKNGPASL